MTTDAPIGEAFLADKIRLLMALRTGGVRDTRVLSALEVVPRELFVPKMFRDKAYADVALPIALGQTISQPTVVAWMTSALDLNERCRVLEIGTGSGYQAAILARLCRRVYTIERFRELQDEAAALFQHLGLDNIMTRVGDGTRGWQEAAPFDRIIVTAAAREVPEALLEQLAAPGIMVIPVGDPLGEQALLRIVRAENGETSMESLMDVRFVPLIKGKVPF